MTTKKLNITAELQSLKNDPIEQIAPEATAYHEWKQTGRKLVSNLEERTNLDKKYKGAHFNNFYKFIAREFPNLIFEKDNEHQYFLYDEERGVYDSLTDVFIKELVTRMYINEGFADKGKVGEVRQCLLRMRSMFPERGVKLEHFDNDDNMFHCANGWLNVITHEFEPHTPKRLSRYTATVKYDKNATAPSYEAMMKSYGLSDDKLRVLHQFSGLCLTGDISQQKMLVLLGRPGCGKSTVVEIWRKVLGQIAIVKSLTTFSNEGAVRFIGGQLAGKTLIHFDEADVKRAELGAHISNLVTGDVIDVERKMVNVENIIVKNRLKCILSANKLPPGQDGIFRRMILIKFEKSFTDDMTADRGLPAKLEAELSGILNRMLEGLADLRKMGVFTEIAGHDELIEEYKAESDIMAEFMETFFDPIFNFSEEEGRASGGIPSSVMFATYRKWAEDNGVDRVLKLTPQKFGRMLAGVSLNKFAKVKSHRTSKDRTWRGLKPKEGVVLVASGEHYVISAVEAVKNAF
jgi:P4 family phage/plasmid primase-like protien